MTKTTMNKTININGTPVIVIEEIEIDGTPAVVIEQISEKLCRVFWNGEQRTVGLVDRNRKIRR